MKKMSFTAAIAVLILGGLSSCRKCEICTKDSSPEVRICEKDYNSNTEYSITLDVLEAGGYNCR
jgi:hypothetical protein